MASNPPASSDALVVKEEENETETPTAASNTMKEAVSETTESNCGRAGETAPGRVKNKTESGERIDSDPLAEANRHRRPSVDATAAKHSNLDGDDDSCSGGNYRGRSISSPLPRDSHRSEVRPSPVFVATGVSV